MNSLSLYLIVALGGALGSVGRYALSVWMVPLGQTLPWGTILINILGSLVIGFFGTFTLAHGKFPVSENARIFVMVGVCGGFTTFSAFSLQTLDMLRNGAVTRAAANIFLSVILCIGAVACGHYLASALNNNGTAVAQTKLEKDA